MIEVVEYQPTWSTGFTELRAAYGAALHATGVRYQSIEHVGSTSVPGLAAKPIIDVDVVVAAADAEQAARALSHIGLKHAATWACQDVSRFSRLSGSLRATPTS